MDYSLRFDIVEKLLILLPAVIPCYFSGSFSLISLPFTILRNESYCVLLVLVFLSSLLFNDLPSQSPVIALKFFKIFGFQLSIFQKKDTKYVVLVDIIFSFLYPLSMTQWIGCLVFMVLVLLSKDYVIRNTKMEENLCLQLFSVSMIGFIHQFTENSGFGDQVKYIYSITFSLVIFASIGLIVFEYARFLPKLIFPLYVILCLAIEFWILESRSLFTYFWRESVRHKYLVLYWIISFIGFGIGSLLISFFGFDFSRTVKRKLFHLMVIVLFTPALVWGKDDFLSIQFANAFGLFVFIEVTRKIYGFSFFEDFIDGKDKDLYLTHIYLLLGCAFPLWFVSKDGNNSSYFLQKYVGIVVLGVGDSMGSLIGKRFGRTRFQNTRSLEGTIAVFGSIFLSLCLVMWIEIGGIRVDVVLVIFLVSVLVSLYELTTKEVDNLVLPLYSIALLNIGFFVFGI